MTIDAGTKHLRLSSRVCIESMTDDAVVVYHRDRSSRLRLTRPLYELVRQLDHGRAVAESLPAGRDHTPILDVIAELERKGFLIGEGASESGSGHAAARRLAATSHTLFRAPARRRGDAPTDIAVIGAPLDLGTSTWAGARWAPAEIRKRSYETEYTCDARSGRPRGWFDVQRRARVLEGTTFADWGDLTFEYGEPPERIYDRLAEICGEAAGEGSFPLLLGGDQAVAYSGVKALQERQRLTVVYLDAHTDFEDVVPGAAHSHASTARRIASLPNVHGVVEVGHRGYTLHDKSGQPWPKLTVVTLWTARERGASAVLDALPPELPCYLSIDINALDPVHAPATSNICPGGFTPDELKSLLYAVGRERRFVGLDLCGINPERDTGFLTTKLACHLLLGALDACVPVRLRAERGFAGAPATALRG